MRHWHRWRGDGVVKNRIKVRGKFVASWVDVDGGIEGLDVDGLFDAPLDPIMLRG